MTQHGKQPAHSSAYLDTGTNCPEKITSCTNTVGRDKFALLRDRDTKMTDFRF